MIKNYALQPFALIYKQKIIIHSTFNFHSFAQIDLYKPNEISFYAFFLAVKSGKKVSSSVRKATSKTNNKNVI